MSRRNQLPHALWHRLMAVQVFGVRPQAGKTVVSTLLAAHFRDRNGWKVNYLKLALPEPNNNADVE